MNDVLIVNEIFYSLDGEGKRSGRPAVFIRIAGCNLKCNYCDTGYAMSAIAGKIMSVNDIMQVIAGYHCKNVTVTGGEPLNSENCKTLLERLCKEGYNIVLETNGSIPISEVSQFCSVCMDWKMPSSGMCAKMLKGNLLALRNKDVLKMVVREQDLNYAESFLMENRLDCPVYISPVFGEVSLQSIAEFIKQYKGHNVLRMQVQLHKIIWEPDARGV